MFSGGLVIISNQHGYNLEGTICNRSSRPYVGLILFHCDNQAVVDIWDRGSTRASHTMGLVCLLYFCASHYNINVCFIHVAGVRNDIADSLSHFEMDKFRKLAPRSEVLSDRIPAWPTQIFMTASCNAGIMVLLNPCDIHTSLDSKSLSHSAVSTPLLRPQHHP